MLIIWLFDANWNAVYGWFGFILLIGTTSSVQKLKTSKYRQSVSKVHELVKFTSVLYESIALIALIYKEYWTLHTISLYTYMRYTKIVLCSNFISSEDSFHKLRSHCAFYWNNYEEQWNAYYKSWRFELHTW